MSSAKPIPSSVLIVGSGVFGLSTAYAMALDPEFKDTSITVVDRQAFPAADAASIDTSRIIRPDYADPFYAALAYSALPHWRSGPWGANARYTETGLCLTAAASSAAYVHAAHANVLALEGLKKLPNGKMNLEVLRSREEIRASVGTGGASGEVGYVNWGSGWADAEGVMRWLWGEVVGTGRVRFVTATVQRLLLDQEKGECGGVLLAEAVPDPAARAGTGTTTTLTAELTVVAAGAWSPALVDLRSQCRATGQPIGYIPISAQDQERLCTTPTLLNLSTGCFSIPPPKPAAAPSTTTTSSSASSSSTTPTTAEAAASTSETSTPAEPQTPHLKLARHGHGYLNPVSIPHPELPGAAPITVSLPRTHLTTPALPDGVLPAEALGDLRGALRDIHPPLRSSGGGEAGEAGAGLEVPISAKPFTHTRLCWYTDTPTGDFLIAHHPRWTGLFLATGGSGHGFKFLPVIGREILGVLLGRGAEAGGGEGRGNGEGRGTWGGKQARDKWAWKGDEVGAGEERWAGDGSRGGERGCVLERELGRGARL